MTERQVIVLHALPHLILYFLLIFQPYLFTYEELLQQIPCDPYNAAVSFYNNGYEIFVDFDRFLYLEWTLICLGTSELLLNE